MPSLAWTSFPALLTTDKAHPLRVNMQSKDWWGFADHYSKLNNLSLPPSNTSLDVARHLESLNTFYPAGKKKRHTFMTTNKQRHISSWHECLSQPLKLFLRYFYLYSKMSFSCLSNPSVIKRYLCIHTKPITQIGLSLALYYHTSTCDFFSCLCSSFPCDLSCLPSSCGL